MRGGAFFVPSTSSQKRRRQKRKRLALIIPQTPSSPSSSSSECNDSATVETLPKTTKKVRFKMPSSSDSDANPEFVQLSQANILHMESDSNSTANESGVFFLRRSVYDGRSDNKIVSSSDTDSVEIPNAQLMKYTQPEVHTPSDHLNDEDTSTPPHTQSEPSPIPKENYMDAFPGSPMPTPTPPISQDPNLNSLQHSDQPLTSTPKESVDGAYSLVANNLKLSTL